MDAVGKNKKGNKYILVPFKVEDIRKIPGKRILSLGELESRPGSPLTVFFTFFLTGIPFYEPGPL